MNEIEKLLNWQWKRQIGFAWGEGDVGERFEGWGPREWGCGRRKIPLCKDEKQACCNQTIWSQTLAQPFTGL